MRSSLQSLPKPDLTSHPVDVGHRTEAVVLSELVRRGYRVLLPFGVNQRYDLVLESDGRFLKVQCKTGRLRDGAVRFKSVSVQSNTKGTCVRDYAGEVDFFAVYCPETAGVYLMPADEVTPNVNFLRVDPTRNNQSKRVRWARDYELPA
jgi:hypothetical protein